MRAITGMNSRVVQLRPGSGPCAGWGTSASSVHPGHFLAMRVLTSEMPSSGRLDGEGAHRHHPLKMLAGISLVSTSLHKVACVPA